MGSRSVCVLRKVPIRAAAVKVSLIPRHGIHNPPLALDLD